MWHQSAVKASPVLFCIFICFYALRIYLLSTRLLNGLAPSGYGRSCSSRAIILRFLEVLGICYRESLLCGLFPINKSFQILHSSFLLQHPTLTSLIGRYRNVILKKDVLRSTMIHDRPFSLAFKKLYHSKVYGTDMRIQCE
jgi:hypothetical protein